MISEINFLKYWPEIQKSVGNYLLPVTFLICGLLTFRYLPRGKGNLPPGPIGLPLVGYLPFLGKEPFKTLDSLRQKYGNVFSLYLRRTYVVVLGDYSAVTEAFSKPATNNRPPKVFSFIQDGSGVAGANGEDWVEQRKLVQRTMRSVGFEGSKWARLVEEDVSDFVKLIASQNGRPIDIEIFVKRSIRGSILTLVFGRRLPEGPDGELIISAANKVLRFFSPSGIWNFFPSLCYLLVMLKFTSYHKDFHQLAAFSEIVRKEVELHKKSQEDSEKIDFISQFITSIWDKEGKETSTNDRKIIGNSRVLLVGGIATTKTLLSWLFLTMASYPEVQEKVHKELDSMLGKEGRAIWEDHSKFPFTYAVILETQRWKTIVPLNVARMAAEDIQVCGYDIPKGTTIIANYWGLHNDTRYWNEPEKFIPERFLQNGVNEVDVKKESFVPFSYGKRKCMDENVAMTEAFLYFASIMQSFEVRVPGGGKPKMEAILGMAYEPIAQKLCFVPRK